MTGEQVSLQAAEAFYRACLVGIRFMRACPQDRRASSANLITIKTTPSEDATDWLEVLLTHASATWGPAFSPARVFQFSGLAAEEPFGPNWPVLPKSVAAQLIKESESMDFTDCAEAMKGAAEAWNIAFSDVNTEGIQISPQTGLLLAGPSAIASAVKIFSQRSDLNWAKQVAVVARRPDTRHIAGLAGLFVNSRGATKLLSPNDAPNGATSPAYAVFHSGHSGVDEVLISEDADSISADFARRAKEGLEAETWD